MSSISCTSNKSQNDMNFTQPPLDTKGEVIGRLCYPSDYLPKMTVYLKEVNTKKTYTLTTKEDQEFFRFIDIPYGKYIAYAYSIENVVTDEYGLKVKSSAGFTKAVPCGLTVECVDHTLIIFNVDSRDTISICDSYGAIVPLED
jgi:hypothetical protein